MINKIITEVINSYVKQIITESKNDKKIVELIKNLNLYDEEITNNDADLITYYYWQRLIGCVIKYSTDDTIENKDYNITKDNCEKIIELLKRYRTKGNDEKYNQTLEKLNYIKDTVNFSEEDSLTPYQRLVKTFLNRMTNRFFAQAKGGKNWYASHFIGIIKLLLKFATSKTRKNRLGGTIKLTKTKEPLPEFNPRIVYIIENIITNMEKDSSSDEIYSNSFNKFDTFNGKVNKKSVGTEVSLKELFDKYYNENSLTRKYGMLDNHNKEEFDAMTSGNGEYKIFKMRSFKDALTNFSALSERICYLYTPAKYEHYGNYAIYVFVHNNSMNAKQEKNSKPGRLDPYRISVICVAINTNGDVAINGRYGWNQGGTDGDYSFDEFKEITGTDIKDLVEDENLRNNLTIRGDIFSKLKGKKYSDDEIYCINPTNVRIALDMLNNSDDRITSDEIDKFINNKKTISKAKANNNTVSTSIKSNKSNPKVQPVSNFYDENGKIKANDSLDGLRKINISSKE